MIAESPTRFGSFGSWFLGLLAPARAESRREAQGLVARIRRGDVDAVGEAYDVHHEEVRALAGRLIGSTALAEELVYEVFVALPKRLGAADESGLGERLLSLTAARARPFVRRARRERARTTSLLPGDAKYRLTRALDVLSYEHRLIFVLCRVERRTAAQASRIAGACETTVSELLCEAEARLRGAAVRLATTQPALV